MIEQIRDLVGKGKIKIRHHARIRMRDRNIYIDDVIDAISSGEVIEEYPGDKPFPSCLIFSRVKEKPIHVVCALSTEEVIVITAYPPDPHKWIKFKVRRKPI